MKHKSIVVVALLVVLVAVGWTDPRGWMGIYHYELDQAMQTALAIPHGLMVKEVVAGSPAEKAGLQVGDVLVRIDSEDIIGTEDLSGYVGARPGRTVRLEVVRQGKPETLTAELGTRDRQLELGLENLTPLKEVSAELKPAVRNMIDDYLAEMRTLRQEIAALQKDIERLRRDLKKVLEK